MGVRRRLGLAAGALVLAAFGLGYLAGQSTGVGVGPGTGGRNETERPDRLYADLEVPQPPTVAESAAPASPR